MADKKRILVVDDEINMCQALFDVLEQEGFLVTTASDRNQVLKFFASIEFDLLLLDIRLRGEDGIKLIQEVKELKPDIAVIIMTGYPTLDSAIEAARLGISDYLLKPISMESLKASIDNALRQKQREVEKNQLGRRLEEANQRLAKMQESLNQSLKLASLGKIGPGMFHEVKNLLGIMNISLYYLKKNMDTKDLKLKKHIDIIEKEIEHSNSIVMGLLNFSRVQEEKSVLQDLNQLIEETVSLLEHELQLKGIKLIRNYDVTLPLILLEPAPMKQVFINLILNAQEAMPKGGELRISTRKELNKETRPQAMTIFSDTGCGIKKENLDKIFAGFFTTKENSGGLGLGLLVSQEIIKRHKGTIEVESQELYGTEFRIRLPIVKTEFGSSLDREKISQEE
jgi:signal transduction histidine kinase